MARPELLWYILSIKPKQEQSVIKNLNIMGVESYLPLYKKKKKVKKEKTDVIVPLFPGYLFCRFDFDDHYQKIRYTRGVKKVLGNKQSLWIIDKDKVEERHRHRYELNNLFRQELADGGLVFSGIYQEADLVLYQPVYTVQETSCFFLHPETWNPWHRWNLLQLHL